MAKSEIEYGGFDKEMNEDIIKSIDTANKIRNHKSDLQLCEQYLSLLQITPTEAMAYKANQFATEVYNDILQDDTEIAVVNTCPVKRNLDFVTEVNLNLKAVINMLEQILTKEGKEELDNIKNAIK